MKRTNSLTLFAASLVTVLGACAGGEEAKTDSTPAPSASAAATQDSASQSAAGAPGALLDPNTASQAQLMALPGMDSATTAALIARRPFQNMLAVDSILARKMSETQRDTVYERMFKRLDLNAASKQEIMLIPGVGDKMHHEFEEYRPYDNIAKFRREIAKYVKDTTIARYEKYIEIR